MPLPIVGYRVFTFWSKRPDNSREVIRAGDYYRDICCNTLHICVYRISRNIEDEDDQRGGKEKLLQRRNGCTLIWCGVARGGNKKWMDVEVYGKLSLLGVDEVVDHTDEDSAADDVTECHRDDIAEHDRFPRDIRSAGESHR